MVHFILLQYFDYQIIVKYHYQLICNNELFLSLICINLIRILVR